MTNFPVQKQTLQTAEDISINKLCTFRALIRYVRQKYRFVNIYFSMTPNQTVAETIQCTYRLS